MNTNYLKKSQERALQQREEEEELIRPVGFSKDSVVFKKSIVGSQIRQSIFRIKEVRRMQFACNLILSDNGDVGGGLGCSVKAYTLYSHEKIKKNDLLLYTREETLKKVFSTADLTQNGKKIELSKDHKKSYIDKKEEAGIRKGYPIGGSDDDVVILNKEQLEFLTNYSFDHRLQEPTNDTTDPTTDDDNNELPILFSEAPYLKLIGFRDLSKFNPIYSCGAPTFLTADLDNGLGTSALKGGFSNSLATFGSLYRSCIKLQQYAIVIGCTRSNSRPFLYAMYPTQTTNSSKLIEGEEFPQGFLLIKMPWLEDVRSLPGEYIRHTKEGASSSSQTDPELVNHFKEILPKFELENYDPKEFPNPSLNFFYKVVKHEILQMDFGPSERTLSKNDETMKRLADLKMFVNSDDSVIDTLRKINLRMNEIERTMEKKRSSVDVSEKEKEKIIKKSKPVKEITEKEMLTAWKYETMIQFSMDQLRGFRKKYPQIQSASKKADLIENITKFLDSRVRKKPT
ncbi:KU70 ATP-dependent DNA helicase II subunit 1 [Candida maltosa Xu316]